MQEKVLLPLDAERVVTFKVKNDEVRTFYFPRLLLTDFKKAMRAMSIETEKYGEDKVLRVDSESSMMELVVERVAKVEGYKLRNAQNLMDAPKWKSLLPQGHVLHVSEVLADVRGMEVPADLPVNIDLVDVALRCSWNGSEGKMVQYSGLIHRFTPPDIKQQARLRRQRSEARMVGGSRTGLTRYGNANELMLVLYDELIVEIDGYSFSGRELKTKDEAVEFMDATHKVAAIDALFASPEEIVE
jgi:hypothetical protein